MQKYVAFMAGLPFDSDKEKVRALFARLGFSGVEPFRSADTVVFETAPVGVIGPLEAQISRHLKRSLELQYVWTFLRTPRELASIVDQAPFSAEELNDKNNLAFVVLLSEEPDERTARALRIRRSDNDTLKLAGTHIYWLRKTGGDAPPPPALSEIIDAPATVRSFKTISMLASAHSGQSRKKPSPDASQSAQSRR